MHKKCKHDVPENKELVVAALNEYSMVALHSTVVQPLEFVDENDCIKV